MDIKLHHTCSYILSKNKNLGYLLFCILKSKKKNKIKPTLLSFIKDKDNTIDD